MAKKIKLPPGLSSSTKDTLRKALKEPKPMYTPQHTEEQLRWVRNHWSGMSNKESQSCRSRWYQWHAQDDPLKGKDAGQVNAEHERARRQRDAASRRAHHEAAHKTREITWIERERLAVEKAERLAATYPIEGLEAVEHYESETADGDDTGAEQDDQDSRWMELFIYENAAIEEKLGQGQEDRGGTMQMLAADTARRTRRLGVHGLHTVAQPRTTDESCRSSEVGGKTSNHV